MRTHEACFDWRCQYHVNQQGLMRGRESKAFPPRQMLETRTIRRERTKRTDLSRSYV